MIAAPDKDQQKDVDFLLSMGEIFSLIVYSHLILENAEIYDIEPGLVNQIFDIMVRDLSKYALDLHNKANSNPRQMKHCLKMIRKPVADQAQYDCVWDEYVHSLNGVYEMNE